MLVSAYKEIATDLPQLPLFLLVVCCFFFPLPINNKEMYMLTVDLLHLAAHPAWFEAIGSDTGPQLNNPLMNQDGLDVRITLIWGLLVCLIKT